MSTTRNHHSACSHHTPPKTPDSLPLKATPVQESAESSWAELLNRFRVEADALRTRGGTPSGPAGVGVAVVAEALDIGATIAASAQHSQDLDAGQGAVQIKVTSAATDIDYRHLERRTRALRAALNGIDDYVWWGGLATAE